MEITRKNALEFGTLQQRLTGLPVLPKELSENVINELLRALSFKEKKQ